MASAGRVQTLLMCAKAQERHAMLPDRFSVGYFWLGTRLLPQHEEEGYFLCSCSHQNRGFPKPTHFWGVPLIVL